MSMLHPESRRPAGVSTPAEGPMGVHVFLGHDVVAACAVPNYATGSAVGQRLARLPEFEGCQVIVARRAEWVTYLPCPVGAL